jgi:hypothetical protein
MADQEQITLSTAECSRSYTGYLRALRGQNDTVADAPSKRLRLQLRSHLCPWKDPNHYR